MNHLRAMLKNTDEQAVLNAISKKRKGPVDLALLLSPGADAVLEQMALEAKKITTVRFGNVVGLYAPLYLSSYCVGNCPYCGFGAGNSIPRRVLSMDQIEQESTSLVDSGIQDILLVAGESAKTKIDYLADAIQCAKKIVPSVSIEVQPLSTNEYKQLADAGLDGVTLYQETYDQTLYESLHNKGPKADYHNRLKTLHRAGEAGIRRLTLGTLWGLAPWRTEALDLGLHGLDVQKNNWRSQISFGMPRLHKTPDSFTIPEPLDDRSFAHIIAAFRIFHEDAGIVVSTRENQQLRENLLPFGVTHMSAGSRTEPGGYTSPDNSGEQFEVSDNRTPLEVSTALRDKGYYPVFKDWAREFGNKATR